MFVNWGGGGRGGRGRGGGGGGRGGERTLIDFLMTIKVQIL